MHSKKYIICVNIRQFFNIRKLLTKYVNGRFKKKYMNIKVFIQSAG